MNNKKCIHIWLDEDCYETLFEYAINNNRSIANAAAFLLEKEIKNGSL